MEEIGPLAEMIMEEQILETSEIGHRRIISGIGPLRIMDIETERIQMEDTTEEVIGAHQVVDMEMTEVDRMEDLEEIIRQDLKTKRMEIIIGRESKHKMVL